MGWEKHVTLHRQKEKRRSQASDTQKTWKDIRDDVKSKKSW